jgi:hypothetical protein
MEMIEIAFVLAVFATLFLAAYWIDEGLRVERELTDRVNRETEAEGFSVTD